MASIGGTFGQVDFMGQKVFNVPISVPGGGTVSGGVAMTFDMADLTQAMKNRDWEVLYTYSTVVVQYMNDASTRTAAATEAFGRAFCSAADVQFLEFKNFRLYQDGTFKLIITADL